MDVSNPNISLDLSTPIKKIKNLTLTSPTFKFSPTNLYPSISDLDTQMTSKGYSKTLTHKVLDELEERASLITQDQSLKYNQTQHTEVPPPSSRKRYSRVHRERFRQMDSISNHYAASRSTKKEMVERPMNRTEIYQPNLHSNTVADTTDKRHPDEVPSSVTKRRKTLHGPEEVMDSSPTKKDSVAPTDLEMSMDLNSSPVKCTNDSHKTTNNADTLDTSISNGSIPHIDSIPSSSPFKKISPSKGSLNLNKLLNDSDTEFLKPKSFLKPTNSTINSSPSRSRVSSLEQVGLKPPPNSIHQSHSSHTLRSKNSFSSFQDKTLKKKSSIPTLNPNARIHHSVSAAPAPQSKIPTLQKKNSSVSLRVSSHTEGSNSPKMGVTGPILNDTSLYNRKSSLASSNVGKDDHSQNHDIHSSHARPLRKASSIGNFHKKQVTTPQPFSLYNKPTISSSQKSIDKLKPKTESRFSRFMKLNKV